MTAPTLTAEDTRREALKDLARMWHETGSEVRGMRLADLTHPSLTGWELDEAFDTLQGDLALLDGLGTTVHWSDVNELLQGLADERYEAAEDEMHQRVGGDLDVLIRGRK